MASQGNGDAETLRFLVNPAYQVKLASDQQKEATPDRRRRYRHRINELHKSMMQGGSPDASLKATHDAFVGAAIRHIRFEEKRILVEQELEGVGEGKEGKEEVAGGDEATPKTDAHSTATDEVKAFGRESKPVTIDSFVTRTSSAPPSHVPRRRRRKKSKPRVDGKNQNP